MERNGTFERGDIDTQEVSVEYRYPLSFSAPLFLSPVVIDTDVQRKKSVKERIRAAKLGTQIYVPAMDNASAS